jgi:hypothetical protein
MKYWQRTIALVLAGLVTAGLTASGCATPWFGTTGAKKEPAPAPGAGSASDLKQATINYINGLCLLPKEQRDPTFRELNEALLPNHASISCGRAGEL